jgi:hypothetical protein
MGWLGAVAPRSRRRRPGYLELVLTPGDRLLVALILLAARSSRDRVILPTGPTRRRNTPRPRRARDRRLALAEGAGDPTPRRSRDQFAGGKLTGNKLPGFDGAEAGVAVVAKGAKGLVLAIDLSGRVSSGPQCSRSTRSLAREARAKDALAELLGSEADGAAQIENPFDRPRC